MKKFTLIFLIILLITGCSYSSSSKNVSNEMKLDDYLLGLGYKKFQISCKYIFDKDITHIGYVSIYGGTTFMILGNNDIFELNTEKIYSSTNSNCQEAKNNEDAIYYLNLIKTLQIENTKDVYVNANRKRIFIISNDNSIKNILDDYSNMIDVNVIFEQSEIPQKLNGTYDFPVLKTNLKYYELKSKNINKEECEKYADIECNYEYSYETDNISKFYDDILYYDGHIVLDKNLNLYTDSKA